MTSDEDDRGVVELEQELERKLLELTNEERARNGRGALKHDPALAAAAKKQARRCADAGKLSHDLGGSLGSRVKAEGYWYAVVAENLAKRFPPAENILQGWLNSPGHKRNLLGSRFTQTGVGIVHVERMPYACAIYAKPLRASVGYPSATLEASSTVLDEDPEEANSDNERFTADTDERGE